MIQNISTFSPAARKAALRSLMRARRKALSAEDRASFSEQAQRAVLGLPLWREARRIALYMAMPEETDTTLLLDQAWQEKKAVLLPLCSPDTPGVMDLAFCPGREYLRPGAFGIAEPVPGITEPIPDVIGLMPDRAKPTPATASCISPPSSLAPYKGGRGEIFSPGEVQEQRPCWGEPGVKATHSAGILTPPPIARGAGNNGNGRNACFATRPELVVLPGVAFDRQGFRLGMGGGYYDRLLPVLEGSFLVGLAFFCQVTEKLPREPWDKPVHALCTEQGILYPETL